MYEDMKAFTRSASPNAFYISLAGTSYCDESYHIERHDSPNAVIEYVLDGEGTVECNEKSFHVGPDLIYFLPAHTHHRYYASESNPYTKIFMNINGELAEHMTRAFGLSGKYIFDGKGIKGSFLKILFVCMVVII